MLPRLARTGCSLLLLLLSACGDRERDSSDSSESSLAETDSSEEVNTTNWDTSAGPLMVVALGEGDSAAIVLPQATDSTMLSDEESAVPESALAIDLFSRSGMVTPAVMLSPLTPSREVGECRSWPTGRVKAPRSGWRVGFVSGRVAAIPLDSIDAMSSVDSSALAAAIAQSVAALPAVSDPMFRGLPFRVRSAYTFRTDSLEGVIADVVRSVNEEANPQLEHVFLVGERRAKSAAKYSVAYYSRTAGAEEAAQAIELLAVVLIGPAKRPAAVLNLEYDEGGKLGLLERTGPRQWRFRWMSAYTGC